CIELLEPSEINEREPTLLEKAYMMYPSLPVENVDVLIVDEMGKSHSGIGMDPLITGRGKETGREKGFFTRRLVVLRISPLSFGNATGVGHADIITKKLCDSIDFDATYRNVLSSGALERARVPLVAPTERDAILWAFESIGVVPEETRVVRVGSTSKLSEMEVSESLLETVTEKEGIEVLSGKGEMKFDSEGNIMTFE
ncbi:MAG: DUF2088 domain-containing protein, partial [Actinomycetota bacterium]|nr:DUF2088 domain-containing protein [Actinomycetota bacterium]